MKLPKWDGVTRPSVYPFSLVCFVVGYVAVTAFSLGQIKYDDREGPGWKPISRMPDDNVDLSAMAIQGIGLVALGVGLSALLGLDLLWNYIWLR
jgi:hypothetical protein